MALRLSSKPAPLPDQTAVADARIDSELRKAAGRVRSGDLLTGAAGLSVALLAFALGSILLDRTFDLPAWLRQVNLGLFLIAFTALGYRLLVRPLARIVNPRYAARQFESTVPDAKNVLINWVDLRSRGNRA